MFVKWVGSSILNCINIYFFIDPFLLCGRESTRVVGWNVIGRKLGGCNILRVVVEDPQKWNKVVCPAWLALWRKWKKQINGSLIISHRTISCNEMSFRRILSWSENSDGNFFVHFRYYLRWCNMTLQYSCASTFANHWVRKLELWVDDRLSSTRQCHSSSIWSMTVCHTWRPAMHS